MIRDLLLLTRLRMRLLALSTRIWLSFLGFDVDDRSPIQRIYGVYVIVFLAIWVTLMVSWATYTAARVGGLLPPEADAAILAALPWLLAGLLVLGLVLALRGSPVKLNAPDMAYVAGSPLSRRAVVAARFLEALPLPLIIACSALGLLGVVLASPGEAEPVQNAGIRAALAAVPLAVFGLGAMWLLGVGRLVLPVARRPLLWLVPLVLAALVALAPGVRAFLGGGVAWAVSGAAGAGMVFLLALAALALVAAVIWLSERVNMTDVIDESQFYAQLRAIGMYVFVDPSIAGRLQRQASLSRRAHRLPGRLPGWAGMPTLLGRALLGAIRQPLALGSAFLWGITLLYGGVWTLLAHPPVQTAVTWLFVVLLVPPSPLTTLFRADATAPFLRRMLPFSWLTLLLATSLPALVMLLLGGAAGWLLPFVTIPDTFYGIVLLVLLGALVLLCQGLSLVTLPGRRGPIPYAALAALCVGGVLLVDRLAATPLPVVGAAALAIAILGRMLAGAS